MLILYSLYVLHVCFYFVKMEQRQYQACILLNCTVLRNITFNRRLSLFSCQQTVKMAVLPCNIFVRECDFYSLKLTTSESSFPKYQGCLTTAASHWNFVSENKFFWFCFLMLCRKLRSSEFSFVNGQYFNLHWKVSCTCRRVGQARQASNAKNLWDYQKGAAAFWTEGWIRFIVPTLKLE